MGNSKVIPFLELCRLLSLKAANEGILDDNMEILITVFSKDEENCLASIDLINTGCLPCLTEALQLYVKDNKIPPIALDKREVKNVH